jgi:hypothetical protein
LEQETSSPEPGNHASRSNFLAYAAALFSSPEQTLIHTYMYTLIHTNTLTHITIVHGFTKIHVMYTGILKATCIVSAVNIHWSSGDTDQPPRAAPPLPPKNYYERVNLQ